MVKLYYYFAFLSVFLCVRCSSIGTAIEVKETEYPVIINYDKKNNIIYGIKIPLEVAITNNSKVSFKEFITIDYEYTPYNKGRGIEIFKKVNSLVKIVNNKKKVISPSSTLKYVIYSRYRIDRVKEKELFKEKMNQYLEKIYEENKDTLHIGTISEFKQKHKDLFEKLTKNDSISIQLLDDGKFGKRIVVPVKW
ncbi:hypothetical protein [Tenacibaculum sp. 190130A14a]|uniref:Lipoprotein n=1 Tax=Tenacibaculum polynesiense TaxID=3137857 RepID=A0ABP1F281_9FLAO